MIDHSSASRFSIGVPVSATRCSAAQPPHRLGRPRQAVLHRLRLVEYHPAPLVAGQLVDVAGGGGVRAENQVGLVEEFS